MSDTHRPAHLLRFRVYAHRAGNGSTLCYYVFDHDRDTVARGGMSHRSALAHCARLNAATTTQEEESR